MVHNVFIWWRNKPKEEAASTGVVNQNDADAVLNCVKQRETGVEPMVGLFFHLAAASLWTTPEIRRSNISNGKKMKASKGFPIYRAGRASILVSAVNVLNIMKGATMKKVIVSQPRPTRMTG